jgi:23S rRNA (cytosine1962-C5)-methyltransferase
VAPALKTLTLARTLAPSLSRGHPWIYRDNVPKDFGAESGQWVRVRAGEFVGYALWDTQSPIALRVFSELGVPDATWVARRVRAAHDLRAALRLDGVTAYRWLNGEGDGLPGLVVDRYGDYAVVAAYAGSLESVLPWLVSGLLECEELAGIVRRRDDGSIELLAGSEPPETVLVEEYGVRMHADLRHGQKTALFLDQRENRRTVGARSSGKRVLNLFSYTGGFSLCAARGGATRVVSVDVSAPAMEAARRNFHENGLTSPSFEFEVADVFDDVEARRARQESFDLCICDPPSFAHRHEQRERALAAYERLHAQALALVEPSGFYAASSCTGQVTPELFRQVLAAAARRAKRRLQIVHDAGQPLDHPVMAGHPEGRYLKFMVARVQKLV